MDGSSEVIGKRIHITGVVQGVGFRPFVYGLALRHELAGWVCNTSAGVDIEVEGQPSAVDVFIEGLTAEAPPLARIDSVDVDVIGLNGYETFEIRHSVAQAGRFQPISPDVATCNDCLREVFAPADRRYRYPFTNCTNCGPRFTIIQDIPYDRPKTTMAPFEMCPDCRAEYGDPLDRRFHAQPNACPVCGPEVWLVFGGEVSQASGIRGEEAIQQARELLVDRAVVAVKGLGGFHLACDATNEAVLARLRERKGRIDKPFAIMSSDLGTVKSYCHVNDAEQALLRSRERPIVLLEERSGSPISELVAPGNRFLGVMLPYTPLHHLLLEPAPGFTPALVMTSGNFSEEPIVTDNSKALERLVLLADAFLLHDRDIESRCDDSVVRIFRGTELPIRRSRGYAPYPVRLPFRAPPILACGAELKNTFCLTRERYAFLSHHIGDLENFETLAAFEQAVEHYERLFRVTPKVIAYDLHPEYLSTKFARSQLRSEGSVVGIGVQHHHAHIAACMAEHGLHGDRPVIGVSFDGTGYGTDGAIWGGEFLVADYNDFRRAAHLAYVPLPGGDAAIRKPYRAALAHLYAAGIDWDEALAPVQAAEPTERGVIRHQIESGFNAPPTSSMGRLFDAVSALAGLRQTITYEAQAAIELEMIVAADTRDSYPFGILTGERQHTRADEQGDVGGAVQSPEGNESALVVDAAPMIRAVTDDVRAGVPAAVIAARFHNGLARMIADMCRLVQGRTGLGEVALSGGVWQNTTLLERVVALLEAEGFAVYTHRLVPPNDGGIALGQAVVAAWRNDTQ